MAVADAVRALRGCRVPVSGPARRRFGGGSSPSAIPNVGETLRPPASGRVATRTYPEGPAPGVSLTTAFDYNGRGYPTAVRDAAPGGVAYWQANDVDAEGRVTKFDLGNGVTTDAGYHRESGRLSGLTTEISGGPNNGIQELRYEFDGIGNLTERRDDNRNLREAFTYDGVNRLTGAEVLDLMSQQVVAAKTCACDPIGSLIARKLAGVDEQVVAMAGNAGQEVRAASRNGGRRRRRTGCGI